MGLISKSFPKTGKPLLAAKGAPERQTVYLGSLAYCSISAARIVFVTQKVFKKYLLNEPMGVNK